MSFTLSPTHMYSGSDGRGAWARPLSELVTSTPPPASGRPAAFGLEQNYPNPFNPATRLRFSVGTAGDRSHGPCRVQLAVYDLIGRRVAVLADGPMEPGDYQVTWDAGHAPSGVYVYTLTAGGYSASRTMILLK